MTVVIGEPIPVPKIEHPTPEQVRTHGCMAAADPPLPVPSGPSQPACCHSSSATQILELGSHFHFWPHIPTYPLFHFLPTCTRCLSTSSASFPKWSGCSVSIRRQRGTPTPR